LRRLLAVLALVACTETHEPPAADKAAGAIALFERRTAADSRDHLSATTLAELYLTRAESSGDADDWRQAESAARTALERQKDHPAAIVALARAATGQGRTDEGRGLVLDLLDRQPRHVGALCAAFDFALAAKDLPRAEAYAERLLGVNEEPATLRRLAQMAETKGDVDRAVALYRRAAADAQNLGALPTEVADYHRRAATALRSSGRDAEAARELDAAQELALPDRSSAARSPR
jgi:tetratricopeptide (TPR) repeat protein